MEYQLRSFARRSFHKQWGGKTRDDNVRCGDSRCRPLRTICGFTLTDDQRTGGSCVWRTHVLLGSQYAGRDASPLQLDGDTNRRSTSLADARSLPGRKWQSSVGSGSTRALRPVWDVDLRFESPSNWSGE